MSDQKPQMLISYMLLRKLIGCLGILLPIILVFGAFASNCQTIQGSISDYYHTEMRNIFVGILCAVALFMFTYKGYDKRDAIAGNLACFFALGVAFFPTSVDASSLCTTDCAENCITYGEWIKIVHFTSAALFFSVLIYFSLFLFREPRKRSVALPAAKRKRNFVFKVCGYVMVFCVFAIALYHFVLIDNFPELAQLNLVFWFEVIALWAFGISWLTKGQFVLKDN
ncbi:MAG: hypothetical protein EX263_12195 [Flavobacteriaceae bacterium]|nr:MAG: hypothetical protein EX263_12195 [Flavobacteriaceae bacterium]